MTGITIHEIVCSVELNSSTWLSSAHEPYICSFQHFYIFNFMFRFVNVIEFAFCFCVCVREYFIHLSWRVFFLSLLLLVLPSFSFVAVFFLLTLSVFCSLCSCWSLVVLSSSSSIHIILNFIL